MIRRGFWGGILYYSSNKEPYFDGLAVLGFSRFGA